MAERNALTRVMKKVLVVGQTPPPYGGQAVMIQRFLQGDYGDVELFHVRMAFSKEMGKMGEFGLQKVLHLVAVVLKIFYFRVRYNISILYYPPSGPVLNAILRDMAILFSTRWMFRRTIFQFFAGGISEIYEDLPGWLRLPFRISFFGPDVAIRPSVQSPDDGAFLGAKSCPVVSWATLDNYESFRQRLEGPRSPSEILFVGVLRESKGIGVLLDACSTLVKRGADFRVGVMGEFESPAVESELKAFVRENGLSERVRFFGVLTGDEYYRAFSRASIFCFPTFFESENVPLVTIDAAKFGVPIVATRWRGVPSVVEDGVNGLLVPIRDPAAVADKLSLLLDDPELRRTMGQEGRRIFLERFTIEVFYDRMKSILDAL